MATVEDLFVNIKTTYDATGVNQARTSVQQLSKEQETANTMLQRLMAQQAATLENYKRAFGGVTQLGGTAPTLGPGAFGIQAGGGGGTAATAGQITQTAVSVRQLGLAFLGASTAGTVIHHVMQQIVQTTGDSIQAYRLYQRALPGLTVSANNLDAAFASAQVSAAKFENALGRLAAPAVAGGLKAEASAVDNLADALNR